MSHIHHECELERHIVEQLEELPGGWLASPPTMTRGGHFFPRMCWAGWRKANQLPWKSSAP